MTKKTRTILFYSFVSLFLLLCPPLILYSQGYRFDPANRKITQTGGLFLKIEPKQSDVYVNGTLEKRTDFFFGSVLVKNLIPKKYKIEVEKDGYQTWEKNLEVKEKEVTEAKSIILFPQNPEFSLLESNIENLWFSEKDEKIPIKGIASPTDSGWSLNLYDPYKKVKSFLTDEKSVYSKGAEFLSLDFSKTQQQIYLNVSIKDKPKSFVLDYSQNPPVLTEKATSTFPTSTISYVEVSGGFYYLDNSGYLFKTDSQRLNQQKINEFPLLINPKNNYEIIVLSGRIFVKENQALYAFDQNLKSFQIFFDSCKGIKISPDSKNFLIFSENEIWILPTQSDEKTFLTRFSEKIGDIYWLNNDYFVFTAGNKIKISEIDGRDKLNIIDVGEFSNPEIFFSQTDKKLYVFSENILYSSIQLLQ
jgi:hypothetical protein